MTGLCQGGIWEGHVGVMFIIFGQCVPTTLPTSLESKEKSRGLEDRQADLTGFCPHTGPLDRQLSSRSLTFLFSKMGVIVLPQGVMVRMQAR